MLKHLRIAVTVLSLVACVLLTAMWVRSYWWRDRLEGRLSKSALFNAWSVKGQLSFLTHSKPGHWLVTTVPVQGPVALSTQFACGIKANDTSAMVYFPHWIPIVFFAAVAAAPWLKWSRRFSLRTVLIATTLVAVGLGIVVAIARLAPLH